jgi:hypothetical protein
LLQESTQQKLTRHILEDRGLLALREENEQPNEEDEDEDEEAIYSAVLASGRYKDTKDLEHHKKHEDESHAHD